MKIKILDTKKPIPMWNSYSGFSLEDWETLNNGEEIDVDSIPPQAKEYVKKTNDKEKK